MMERMSGPAQPYPILPGSDVEESKIAMRQAVRAAREMRSDRLRGEAAQAVAEVVAQIPEVAAARCVASYAARPAEVGTAPLLDLLAARGTRVLLPVLGAGLSREWAEYAGQEDLAVRAPGRPPEPSGPSMPPEVLAEADVVLAPALAVDTRGVRLGQGGGWYDRALEYVRPGVKTFALVYPEEIYDASEHPLPVEEHDVGVSGVATPLGWRELG